MSTIAPSYFRKNPICRGLGRRRSRRREIKTAGTVSHCAFLCVEPGWGASDCAVLCTSWCSSRAGSASGGWIGIASNITSFSGSGGFEASGGRGFGVEEDGVDGLNGEVDHGFVVLRVDQGFSEGELVATPVGDGVAVDAGLGRGVRYVRAF